MKPVIRVSSIDQLLRCPASKPLSEHIPSVSGREANDGTYIHYQIGDILVKQHGATKGSDYKKPKMPKGYEFNVKDAWIIDACVRNALEFVPSDWSIIVEEELAWEYDNFILVGHADLIGLSPDVTSASVKDWKTGSIFVDNADINYQILGYSVLTWRSWETIDWMRFGLFQPRAFMGDDGERDSEDLIVGRKEFEQAEQFLVSKIDEALEQSYIVNTGPKQCRWCPAVLRCPAIREEINRMQMQITQNDIAKASEDVSNHDLAELLHGAKVLSPIIDKVTDEAKRRLKDGEELIADGKQFKYQRVPYGKKVVDMPTFVRNVESVVGSEKLMDSVKIGMDDTRKLIAKVKDVPQKSKKEDKECAQKIIEKLNGDNLVQNHRELINTVDVEE